MKSKKLQSKSNRRRCTKGASKQRRESLNCLINYMRDALPLPESGRQQLSQIQVMALARAYIQCSSRLANVFELRNKSWSLSHKFDFAEALPGFLIAVSDDYKLLYVSDNVKNYLGYTSVDLLTRNGTIYDIVSDGDRTRIQTILEEGFKRCGDLGEGSGDLSRSSAEMFECRIRVSRSVRRQSRCDRYKLMYIRGHFVTKSSASGEGSGVFVGVCSTQPCTQPQDANSFISRHATDLQYKDIDECGEFHLGYSKNELSGCSLYSFVHPADTEKLQTAHLQVMRGDSPFASVSVRLQAAMGHIIPLSIRLQRCKTRATGQHIICSCRILDANHDSECWSAVTESVADTQYKKYETWAAQKDESKRGAKRARATKDSQAAKASKTVNSPSTAAKTRVSARRESERDVAEFLNQILKPNPVSEVNFFERILDEKSPRKSFSFMDELNEVEGCRILPSPVANPIDYSNFISTTESSNKKCQFSTAITSTNTKILTQPTRTKLPFCTSSQTVNHQNDSFNLYSSAILSPASIESCVSSLDYDFPSRPFEHHRSESPLDYVSPYNTSVTPPTFTFSPQSYAGSSPVQETADDGDFQCLSQPSPNSYLSELLSLPELDVALVESLLLNKDNNGTNCARFASNSLLLAMQSLANEKLNDFYSLESDHILMS